MKMTWRETISWFWRCWFVCDHLLNLAKGCPPSKISRLGLNTKICRYEDLEEHSTVFLFIGRQHSCWPPWCTTGTDPFIADVGGREWSRTPRLVAATPSTLLGPSSPCRRTGHLTRHNSSVGCLDTSMHWPEKQKHRGEGWNSGLLYLYPATTILKTDWQIHILVREPKGSSAEDPLLAIGSQKGGTSNVLQQGNGSSMFFHPGWFKHLKKTVDNFHIYSK